MAKGNDMKSKFLGLLAVGLLMGPMASNAVMWNWTYTRVLLVGETSPGGGGTFTTNDLASGSYLITGITGTYEGNAITSLLPTGSFGNNDSLLFETAPQLTVFGFSFVAAGVNRNFYWGIGYQDFGVGILDSFSASRVPSGVHEPGTLALLGLGLLALVFIVRRKPR
jgi:hypothetical protein